MGYNKETDLYEGWIYKIVNDINNKVYIGQTRTGISMRFAGHKQSAHNLKKKTYIANAMRKIGVEHFTIIPICQINCKSIEELEKCLDDKEIEIIAFYNQNNVSLYNQTKGGDHLKTGELYKSVIQYDLQCNKIGEYVSIKNASERTGVGATSISACCQKNGKTYCAGNYVWRYSNDPLIDKNEIHSLLDKYRQGISQHPKGVDQYDLNCNYITSYKTLTEAHNITGIPMSSISNVCLNKTKTTGGYIFRWSNDSIDTYLYANDLKLPNHNAHLPTTGVRVEQRDRISGNIIEIFESFDSAARIVGNNNSCGSTIQLCCDQKTAHAFGYYWCREGQFNKDHFLKSKPLQYDVYDLDENYITTLTGRNECYDFLNRKDHKSVMQCIHKSCDGIYRKAYGYIWKYSKNNNHSYDKIIQR